MPTLRHIKGFGDCTMLIERAIQLNGGKQKEVDYL